MIKIIRKVFKEITFKRIVAVAVNNLSTKILFIVSQLTLDIAKLSVELIIFSLLGSGEGFITAGRWSLVAGRWSDIILIIFLLKINRLPAFLH